MQDVRPCGTRCVEGPAAMTCGRCGEEFEGATLLCRPCQKRTIAEIRRDQAQKEVLLVEPVEPGTGNEDH